jgi:hypothetical protein
LKQGWYSFARSLGHCIEELEEARKAAKLDKKTTLTDEEMAYVAIAYNQGSFNPSKGLKQGFHDSDSGKYYGENIFEYLRFSKSVPGLAIGVAQEEVSAPLTRAMSRKRGKRRAIRSSSVRQGTIGKPRITRRGRAGIR